jgi:hypothetical protein
MTTILLVAMEQNPSGFAIVLAIVWVCFSVWFMGHIDFITYAIPYAKKKKRRVDRLNDFAENFETLRKKEGLTVADYKAAEQELSERQNLVNRTIYHAPNLRRFAPGQDIYKRDEKGNKIPNKSHITHYQDGEPVYRGKLKTPPFMTENPNNKARFLTIASLLAVWFIWLVISS